MAELYEKFTSLYPYPHLRIAPGVPSSYTHHLYLNRLADGRMYGFTPVLVVLDELLFSTIQNNISARTKTPPAEITADHLTAYAEDILAEYRLRLEQSNLENYVREKLSQADSNLFETYYSGFLASEATFPRSADFILRPTDPLAFVSSLMNEAKSLFPFNFHEKKRAEHENASFSPAADFS